MYHFSLTAVPPPLNASAEGEHRSIKVFWNAMENATSYTVFWHGPSFIVSLQWIVYSRPQKSIYRYLGKYKRANENIYRENT